MRRHVLIFGFGLVAVVALMWCRALWTPATAKSDLSIMLIGFTNNPVSTPPPTRLAVAGNGVGLHALFAVTNTSTNNFIRFDTVAVEWREGGGWKEVRPLLAGWPTNRWRGVSGWLWAPGYGCVQAVAWPGISTNISWRLRLSVATDVTPRKQLINEKIGLKIFHPHNAMTVAGPEVSLVTTYKLLSLDGPERKE